MQGFEYAHPESVKAALALLGPHWTDAEVLAGGTDLLALMKDYVVAPKRVVNIKGISELGGIDAGATETKIGALVSFEELLASDHIKSNFAALSQAAAGIASPQIRNMGTVGGDLCQRPRCWYFRAGYGLLALGPDGKSLVPGGDNRYHAILGNTGPAYFVSPSSLGPALIALDATVHLSSAAGARAVSFRGGRLAITPIELDSSGVRELRERLEGVVYESGRSQVLVRVPDAPAERFPAVLQAADAVLAAAVARS